MYYSVLINRQKFDDLEMSVSLMSLEKDRFCIINARAFFVEIKMLKSRYFNVCGC